MTVAVVGATAGVWIGATVSTRGASGVSTDYLRVAEAPKVGDIAIADNGDFYLIHNDEDGQRVWRHPAGGLEPEALPLSANDTSGSSRSVAVDREGAVYFTTRDGNRVLKLEAGRSTPEELSFPGVTPNDVAVGPDGTVVVADAGGGVYALPPGERTAVRLPFPDLYGVSSVAVDSDGDVYAVEFSSGRSSPDRLWKFYSDTTSGAAATILTPGLEAIRDIAVVDAEHVLAIGNPNLSDFANTALIDVTDEFTDRVEVPLDGLSPGSIALDRSGNVYAVDSRGGESSVYLIPPETPRRITPARSASPGAVLEDGSGDAVANAYDETIYGPADISRLAVARVGSNLVLELLWAEGVNAFGASLSVEIDVDPTSTSPGGCLLEGADFNVSVQRSTSDLVRLPPACDGPFDTVAVPRIIELDEAVGIEIPMSELGIATGDEIVVQAISSTIIDERSSTTIQDFAPDDQLGMRVVVP